MVLLQNAISAAAGQQPRSTMYAALASVALGSAAMWSTAAACTYTEHPSSVMYANDALRIPIAAGAEAQNECAATAQAFGLTIASIGVLLVHCLSRPSASPFSYLCAPCIL